MTEWNVAVLLWNGMVGLLENARDAGHLAPDVDLELITDQLAGPLFLHRLTASAPFPTERVDDLVAMVLDHHWRR